MNEMAAMPKKFIFKNSKERERERERERGNILDILK